MELRNAGLWKWADNKLALREERFIRGSSVAAISAGDTLIW